MSVGGGGLSRTHLPTGLQALGGRVGSLLISRTRGFIPQTYLPGTELPKTFRGTRLPQTCREMKLFRTYVGSGLSQTY